MKMKVPFHPIVFYVAFALIVVAFSFFYNKTQKDRAELVEAIQLLVTQQQGELERTQLELESLRIDNESQLLIREEEIEAQKAELSDLSSRLTVLQNKPVVEATPSTSSVVNEWRNAVFKVTCSYLDIPAKKRYTQTGSGIGLNLSDGGIFMTNRHVITAQQNGLTLEGCTASAGGGVSFDLELVEFRVDQELDFAFIVYPARQPFFSKTLGQSDVCQSTSVAQGEEIVILGYPVTGAQNSVTVTEGIISGFETNHYVTSAKIEQGNSGGAAILSSESCVLGLPTFAQVGKVESFARILKLDKLITF